MEVSHSKSSHACRPPSENITVTWNICCKHLVPFLIAGLFTVYGFFKRWITLPSKRLLFFGFSVLPLTVERCVRRPPPRARHEAARGIPQHRLMAKPTSAVHLSLCVCVFFLFCAGLLSVFTSDNHVKQSALLRMIVVIFIFFITTVLHYISWKAVQTLDT